MDREGEGTVTIYSSRSKQRLTTVESLEGLSVAAIVRVIRKNYIFTSSSSL